MTEFLNELRKSVSITEVVGEYVKLRKQGANMSGLCPFHAERSPSFSVSEHKGVFFCFGCQKGGDVISFLQEVQGVSFPEAVRYLASRGNLKVPASFASSRKGALAPETDKDEIYFKLNRFVAQFYHELLLSDRGQAARDYLKSRGLEDETLKSAYLGFAPAAWSELHDFLDQKKAPLDAAEKLGLIRKKNADSSGRGFYDLFRDRVIFPVTDRRGRVVAFGGRALGTTDSDGPKYLNSTESPIFTKGQHMYGIFQAQKHIRSEDLCVIVEGYMDCLALHQSGIGFAVATLGTALTETHVSYLKRLTHNIVVLFDGDAAGRAAQTKAMETFLREGIVARGLSLPDGSDPDDYVRAKGGDALLAMLQNAPYLLDQHILELKTSTGARPEDRTRALDMILPWISQLTSETASLLRLQDLSQHYQLPLDLLERRVDELRKARPRHKAAAPAVSAPRPLVRPIPLVRQLKLDRLELRFLEFSVRFPQQIAALSDFELLISAVQTTEIRTLIETVAALSKAGTAVDASLIDTISLPELKMATSRILAAHVENEAMTEQEKTEWEDLQRHLRRRSLEARRDCLRENIKKADAMGQQEEFLKLMSEFNQVQRFLDHETKGGQISL